MKKFLLKCALGIAILLSNQSIAQVTVSQSIVTNPPATECTSTFLTVAGTHNYGGYTYNGATVSVVGTTVNVTLNYTFGIGIPTITPFAQSVDIGMIPAGTYTMLTNGSVNGTPYPTYTSSLTVNACCPADASFTSDQPSYCVGDVVTLTNTSTGATGYQWYNNGLPVSTSMNYTFTTTSTTHVVELEATDGACTDSLIQAITVYNAPVINSLSVTADTSCIGDLVVFSSSSSGAVGANGKIWFKGTSTAGFGTNLTTFASGAGPHIYTFVASNGACADTSTITVEYLAPPVIDSFVIASTSICYGEDVSATSAVSGATSTEWYVDNVLVGSGTSYSNTPATIGSYAYKILVSNGVCSDSMEQIVTVNSLPALDLGPDTNACGGPVTLDAGTGFTYLWSDASTAQSLIVNDPGTYFVTITNANGCMATDSVNFSSCVGLKEASVNRFKIGPNPASSHTIIQLGQTYASTAVKVLDANGKLYLEQEFTAVDSIEVDVNALKVGVYFIQVNTGSSIETLRLVKK